MIIQWHSRALCKKLVHEKRIVDQKKTFSFVLDVRVFGFAAFLLLFGLLDFPSISPSYLNAGAIPLLVSLFPAGYAIPILLVTVLAFFFRKIPMKALIGINGLSLLIGLVTFVAELLSGFVSVEASIIPLLAFGVGIVCGFASWLYMFEREEMPTYIGMIVVAHLVEALVQVMLFPPLHPFVLGGLVLVLIVTNFVLLVMCSQKRVAQSDQASLPFSQSDVSQNISFRYAFKVITGELWQPLLCVMIIGFSLATMRSITSNSIDFYHWSYSIPAAGKLLGISVFALLWFRKSIFIRSSKLFLFLYLTVLLLIILLPIFGADHYIIFTVVCGGAFNFAYLSALIACVGLIKERISSSLAISGILFSVMYTFVLLGEHAGRFVRSDSGYDFSGLLIVAFLIAFLVSLANIIASIPRENKYPAKTKNDASRVTTTFLASEEDLRANQTLIKQYKLTKRELDVLVLMLSARSAPSIASTLFISENTVKSHTKSIHKKMDVHNRQELLDLVSFILSRNSS